MYWLCEVLLDLLSCISETDEHAQSSVLPSLDCLGSSEFIASSFRNPRDTRRVQTITVRWIIYSKKQIPIRSTTPPPPPSTAQAHRKPTSSSSALQPVPGPASAQSHIPTTRVSGQRSCGRACAEARVYVMLSPLRSSVQKWSFALKKFP